MPRSRVAVLQSARAGAALLSGGTRGTTATRAMSMSLLTGTVMSGEIWPLATQ